MGSKVCDNCRYFCRSSKEARGHCRKHAPRPFVGIAAETVTWPSVYEYDWCGEYKKYDEVIE